VTPINIAKGALVTMGLVVFLVGIRTANEYLRWIGVAGVAIAWLLRFAPSADPSSSHSNSSREDSP
jgi:hypothetical protein